jgi:hypothetical protein
MEWNLLLLVVLAADGEGRRISPRRSIHWIIAGALIYCHYGIAM